jgi:hypothetical protein
VKEDLGGINGKDQGSWGKHSRVEPTRLNCVSDYLTSTYKNDGGIS